MFKKAMKYLADVRQEFTKVLWPTRAELRESSTVVVVLSLMLAVFTFSIDIILNRLLKLIF
jgi:preprotein translocase subunit SecE